jgi:small GTP-binding protein
MTFSNDNTNATTPVAEKPATIGLDADYEAAMNSVRAAIDTFRGCSPDERAELQRDLDQLHAMAEKLAAGKIEIVVFGEISTGKSALINALVGEAVAEVNVRGGWTKDVWNVGWKGAAYCVPGLAESQVVLIDTPGLNEVDGAARAAMAREAAARADLVLFVTDSDLNEVEYSALVELAATHKPIILVLNKADLYPPQELADLMSVFMGPRLAGIVEPQNVVPAKADPRQVEYYVESANGQTRQEWRKPAPDVAALRERILEVLAVEGKALVALNAAMYAADKSDRMGAMRVRMRNEKATATIWSFAVMKALGVASNPLAIADVLGGTAVDAVMVVTLGNVYGIEITTANAKELIASILKAAGWVMLSEAAVSYTSSFFKAVTGGWGTLLTALPQGAAAGYGSYIVGQAARYYFEHGASWGQQGPKRGVARILENTDKQSVLQRIKEEIKKKISVNRYAGK